MSGYPSRNRIGKLHAADRYLLDQIGKATSWVVYFRRSPREACREKCETLVDARKMAKTLDSWLGDNGRRSMIYAITPNGTQWPVPDDYQSSTDANARELTP